MNFKPILFSTLMVQAIIEDRKTQTRRIIKPWTPEEFTLLTYMNAALNVENNRQDLIRTAKIRLGHVLWVRETFQHTDHSLNIQPGYVYKATDPDWDTMEGWKWKPSIFMPKDACRLFLEVTNVRVERLQDISEEDAVAEGVLFYDCEITKMRQFKDYITIAEGYGHPDHDYPSFDTAKESFKTLWMSINGMGSWVVNPWVWVYEFKRIEKPENFISS